MKARKMSAALLRSTLVVLCIFSDLGQLAAQEGTSFKTLDARSVEILLESPVASRVQKELTQNGLTVISVNYTLLGRIRFVVVGSDTPRELVVHRRTGEVLRDLEYVAEPLPTAPSTNSESKLGDARITTNRDGTAVGSIATSGTTPEVSSSLNNNLESQVNSTVDSALSQ